MPWLKTVGCECPECGPDPCTPGCPCTFSQTYNDGAGHDNTYDVTGEFVYAHDLSIDVTGGTCNYFDPPGFAATPWEVEVYANGVKIYDSGCTTGNLSTTVEVPAGTTSLRLLLVHDCSGVCESNGDTLIASFACV